MNSVDYKHKSFVISAILFVIAATLLLYSRTFSFSFVSFDDSVYVIENKMVNMGLTFEGIKWAFITNRDGNWFPLTWISYMLDVSLFGVNPGKHHLINSIYHALNSSLILIFLYISTKRLFESFLVALLFSFHPLHVESVAWISERKDILSAFFMFLSLITYSLYSTKRERLFFILTLLLFVMALMSKPMVVSLPILLFLLDYWPLNRSGENFNRLLVEKIPFAFFSFISCIITFNVQRNTSVVSLKDSPLYLNIQNALISYLQYIIKSFYPINLAVLYPFRFDISLIETVLSLLLLIIVTYFSLKKMRSFPFFFVGWLWFVISLIPVIGIVRIGKHSIADRYTYIPHVGLFILIVWGSTLIYKRFFGDEVRKIIAAAIITVSIIFPALFYLTWKQTGYWRDSFVIFKHAVDVTDKNWLAIGGLGFEYAKMGELDKAQALLEESLKIYRKNSFALINLGVVLNKKNMPHQAAECFKRSIEIEPNNKMARYLYGSYLLHYRNDTAGAISEYEVLKKIDEDIANQLLTLIKLKKL